METTVSAARATLPQLLDRVQDGEEIVITRHGRPVAVVVHPDALRARRAGHALSAAEQLRDTIAAGRDEPLAPEGTLAAERAEQLVREVRAGRVRG